MIQQKGVEEILQHELNYKKGLLFSLLHTDIYSFIPTQFCVLGVCLQGASITERVNPLAFYPQ